MSRDSKSLLGRNFESYIDRLAYFITHRDCLRVDLDSDPIIHQELNEINLKFNRTHVQFP